jgi:YfiH family protein
MRQVHGSDVWYAGAGAAEPPGPVDAMFTDLPGRALCVLVADCAPVLVADPHARIVGVAHAGREGLAAGVVPALVSAMTAAGARPARMRAVIGPSICGACYEVPAELQGKVSAVVPAAACATSAGTSGLDIPAGVRAQLERAGVRQADADGRCTRESPGLYSYRRDGRTGRGAGLIWLAS